MAHLVQTLILRDRRVLLGRWRHGAFAGRITALLGTAPGVALAVDGSGAPQVAHGYGELGQYWGL